MNKIKYKYIENGRRKEGAFVKRYHVCEGDERFYLRKLHPEATSFEYNVEKVGFFDIIWYCFIKFKSFP